jgi:hypothetical protein
MQQYPSRKTNHQESKMKYLFSFFVISFTGFLIFSCGSDPVADGDRAYSEGSYGPALNYYMQAKKEQPENSLIDEKIALTYMKRGHKLFQRTKNIDSFSGNFEKGERFIPDDITPEFEAQYSDMLFHFANAYHQTKPLNEIQKEQYFTKTLDNLEKALAYDENNTAADSLLASIKQQNFQRMFDKGVDFLKQAKKERTNEELYMTAERYLKRAVFFNPESEEAAKQLKDTREKTIRILDTDQVFPFAIAGIKRSGNFLLFDITGLNNSGDVLQFDPEKLTLKDVEGNTHVIDSEETSKYESGLTEKVSLNARERVEGIAAFAIDRSVKADYLNYQIDEYLASKKYLP